MTTLYAVLSLPPAADATEIRDAYRELALKHHPDKGGDHELFCRITEAWGVLGDAERRSRYDAELRLTRTTCSVCGGDGRVWKQVGFTTRKPSPCPKCKGIGFGEAQVQAARGNRKK